MKKQALRMSAFVFASMGAAAATFVSAEEFPAKTIEVVTHAGNGGGTDVTTRMMMLRARRELGQDMVVVNKRGGGGAAALEYYKTVPADGYTILTFTVGHAAVMAKGQGGMTLEDLRPIARATASGIAGMAEGLTCMWTSALDEVRSSAGPTA